MGLLSTLRNKFSLGRPSAGVIQDGEPRWWGGSTSWLVGDTQAGEEVSESNLMQSATCFACTKALSETTAGLPASLMERLGQRKEIAKDDQAWELLVDQPNPEMDSFTFMELLVARTVNAGNFFAEIQRDKNDRPIALWPIHPSRVDPMRDQDGSLYWQVSHDYTGAPEYQDPTWRKQNLIFLSPHNMLNVVGFGSQNGIISPGILPGAQEIGVDFATRRYGADFFKGGAKPSGFVEHPGFIPDETKRNNFRSDLNRIHNQRAHQIGVLWEGAKYQQISVSPDQAQFLQTRRYTSHRICSMYGVPPAIIGDYQDNKFATADAMIRAFVMITLRNLVVRVEKSINRQVLNVRTPKGRLKQAFDSSMIFELALDGLLRGDPEMQAKTWKMMRESGVASANDWLRDVNMNPIEGPEGDWLTVAGGTVRLDQIDNQGDRLKNKAESQTDTAKRVEPAFDKEAVIEGLSELVERPVQVQGVDFKETLEESLAELAEDAVARIHSITTSQINRWREQDPKVVEEKLPEFWSKQKARLEEALQPCQKMADKLEQFTFAESLTDDYISKMSALDNYEIFDESKTTYQPPVR